MITRPFLFLLTCIGLFILIQSLVPTAMAMKRPSDVDEYLLEDQRTRKRKNYVVRMDHEDEILDSTGNMGVRYESEVLPNPSSEELSAFIVDYANLMRNDIILLDNSVETRTRKRGNIKLEKYNHALPDPPCSCESNRDTKDLGENSIPRYVETKNCSTEQKGCKSPYICKDNIYNLLILTRKESHLQRSTESLPEELQHQWVTKKYPISVGCSCVRDYRFKL